MDTMPKLTDAQDAILRHLETRRSVGSAALGEPGPTPDELRRMLAIAARSPDHGKLAPWRFVVIEGEERRRAGEKLAPVYYDENGAMEPEKRAKFRDIIARVFMAAPLVVIVVSRVDAASHIPAWEQELSAGAVCMNLLHAAHALGYAGSWVTGWAAFSPGARGVFGLGESERIVGIVHIGTPREKPDDRPRPDLDAIVTRWRG
jgi:nitroreductase